MALTYHRCPPTALTYHRCPSMALIDHRCPSKALTDHRCPSMALTDHRFPLMALSYQRCSLMSYPTRDSTDSLNPAARHHTLGVAFSLEPVQPKLKAIPFFPWGPRLLPPQCHTFCSRQKLRAMDLWLPTPTSSSRNPGLCLGCVNMGKLIPVPQFSHT